MGCIVGKAQSGVVAENGNTGRSNRTQFEEELSSYKVACRLDPELRSFDAAVQVRTSRIISCLREGVVFRSLSINSLREVTIGLLDVNQSALNNIIELKEDILKNPDLLALVRDYFENCLETLTLFTVLGECLDKARDGEIMIHRAFQCFEEENQSGNSGGYLGTLGALKDFKAAGDPFKKFAEEFPLVRRKQEAMLEKLRIRESKLDEKLKSSKAWRKVSSIIFVAAFAAVFICAVVFAAVAAPPAATSAAAVVTGSMEPVGAWLNSMWNNYERALKGEHEVIKWMHENTNFAVADFHGIRILVDRLEVRINSLEQNADFAVEKEGEEDEDAAVKVGMEEIKKKMEELMRSVEDLGRQVDHCSLDVRKTADFVLRNIRDEA